MIKGNFLAFIFNTVLLDLDPIPILGSGSATLQTQYSNVYSLIAHV